MLQQASLSQIRKGAITRKNGHIVVTMCWYPRGLRREVRDEYRHDLAPDRELFADWKKNKEKFGHEAAFVRSHYEKRFRLTAPALEHLSHLALLSHRKNVYLVCQCQLGERCHREMLLLLARAEYGAHIGMVYHTYPTFLRRIKGLLLSAA